ncbi:MAG: TonB family protein [Bacteroidota bacterium]|nr:TonB family protein [Bacteroidota bacterium]
MQVKKTKKANLERKRTLFLEIGLALVLGIILVAFEWGTSDANKNALGDLSMDENFEEEIINTFQEEEPPPPPEEEPEPEPEQVIEELNVVENDEEESDIDINSEADEDMEIDIDMSSFEETVEEEVEPIPFHSVEDKPVFPGGDAALLKYLAENTNYPEIAKENGIQGKVFIQFVIDKNGNVTSVTVARGVDPYLDKEAKRVVGKLPRWSPGKQRGIPVPVTYIVPINFKLY